MKGINIKRHKTRDISKNNTSSYVRDKERKKNLSDGARIISVVIFCMCFNK